MPTEGALKITEPTTLATDYLLGAVVLCLAVRLWRRGHLAGGGPARLWAGAFWASAAAALLGGTHHGFILHLAPVVASSLWKGTVYAVGLAGLLLLAGMFRATLSGPFYKVLLTFAILKFLVYAVWMATHDSFRYVILDYAPSLLIVLLLAGLSWYRRRDTAAPWVAGGILVSFVAAGIQAAHLAPHPNFNHNDLYHVVQMGAFYLLYRGGMQLKDRRERSPE
jgi:hypothetical protein